MDWSFGLQLAPWVPWSWTSARRRANDRERLFSDQSNKKPPRKGKPSRQMKKADWLIVAGVMFIPTALFVLFGVDALVDYWMHRPSLATDFVHAFLWVGVAISAGLITTGVLMRMRS